MFQCACYALCLKIYFVLQIYLKINYEFVEEPLYVIDFPDRCQSGNIFVMEASGVVWNPWNEYGGPCEWTVTAPEGQVDRYIFLLYSHSASNFRDTVLVH